MIVTDERVARYVSEKLNRAYCPPYTCMGIEKDGRIVAGAIFNVFEGNDCHFTIAAERGALTRSFLRAMGQYGRDQLQLDRITIVTEQEFVADLARRLGAQNEGRLRNHYGPGRDAIVLGILKEDWRL